MRPSPDIVVRLDEAFSPTFVVARGPGTRDRTKGAVRSRDAVLPTYLNVLGAERAIRRAQRAMRRELRLNIKSPPPRHILVNFNVAKQQLRVFADEQARIAAQTAAVEQAVEQAVGARVGSPKLKTKRPTTKKAA